MSDESQRLIARMFCVGFEGPSISAELRELLARGVSSVILFTRNYQSPAQLAAVCYDIKSVPEAAGRPVMICIDQEGGRVQRMREPFTIIPSMRELGATAELDRIRRVARVMARELRAVNIDMNLAPVLDVDSNPANPVIGERSFSSDPAIVANCGRAMIESLQSAGLAACGKHFPGHGDTDIDSHLDLPRLSHDLERLNRIELPPFRAAVAAGVAAIMVSHVMFEAIDSDSPSTMSRSVIEGLLRGQLQFNGPVISDDMEMKAIIDHFGIEEAVMRGAAAGIDLFCICKDDDLQCRGIDALTAAVQHGKVSMDRIHQSNRRLDQLFNRFVRPGSRWSEHSVTLLGGVEQPVPARASHS